MSTHIIVFDLDGTLADTSADLLAAANAAVQDMGFPAPLTHPQDALCAFRGGRAMLKLAHERLAQAGQALPEEDAFVDQGYPSLLTAYGADIARHTTVYPGALGAVHTLRAAGHATAICTNKPEALAVDLIAKLGVADLFDALVGADTLPTRKPDVAPYHETLRRAALARFGMALCDDPRQWPASCLIGDTVTDRETARAAGVPSILVGFGPEGADIARLKPDALLARYDDLPALIQNLLG
ncbi:HAD hydrolase-like protein [Rhodobacteraceae bacterium XHP0102]|nr:HAD hydrolase-like protein [Rhodobacteraceae bacterium XHP0102]